MSYVSCTLVTTLFAFTVLVPVSASSQDDFACPLPAMGQQANAYKKRSDSRCEGFIDKNRSQTDLEIVGFTTNIEFDVTEPIGPLKISVPGTAGRLVRIMSVFDRPEELYRMDGIATNGQPLVWPVAETVSKAGLDIRDANFLGWYEDEQLVFVPLHVSQEGEQGGSGEIVFRIRPGLDLAPVTYRFRTGNEVSKWQEIPDVFAWNIFIVPIGEYKNAELEIKGKDIYGLWTEPAFARFEISQ